ATMAHAQWEARCPECHSGSSLHATSRRTRHKTLSALVLRLRRLNGNYWHLTCVPFFASVHRKSVDKDSRFGWIFRDIGSHLKQTARKTSSLVRSPEGSPLTLPSPPKGRGDNFCTLAPWGERVG